MEVLDILKDSMYQKKFMEILSNEVNEFPISVKEEVVNDLRRMLCR